MKHDRKTKGVRAMALALAGVVALALTPTAGAFELPWARTPKPGAAAAETTKRLVPVGHTVGIKLFSDGVLVVGLSPIDTADGEAQPAKSCGLKEGDIITHINRREVDTIEEVQAALEQSDGETMSIRALRGNTPVELTTRAVQCGTDGSYKLGAWIRDSMAGIGTVTFYDPDTGVFGALGHGVSDVDTLRLMPLSRGAILHSSVTGVEKGQIGTPGQLRGAFDLSKDLGQLYANTTSGIFGTLETVGGLPLGEALPVAARDEVKVGEVTIRSNIQGEEVKEYQAEILRIYPENGEDTRNFLLKVTDKELLEKTGGIVQGMSGSPILQDGKLVGAVTHVLLNDPTQGYGILAENMLKAAGAA